MSPRPATVEPVDLADLARRLGLTVDGRAQVTGVTHASAEVRPGDLFAALPGARVDGADFAAAAVRAGAVAVLASRPLPVGVPVLLAPDPRRILGRVAAEVYGRPCDRLVAVGITGTNGKTTTAHLVDAGLRAAGRTTALIGTLGATVAGEDVGGVRTTPEAADLQALLALAVERGATALTMEVSSHALALHRVAGCHFAVSVFTNLSQDHLDFHADMADYFATKARLFTPELSDAAVIDVGDPWGARLAERVTAIPVTRVDGEAPTRLLGSFNRRNAALAVAALEVLGVAGAADAVAEVGGVPGRMEQVSTDGEPLAIVDYAHTPDAVASLLSAVRGLTGGRVTVVLGCGGDRDRGKRPLMGRAAAEGADRVVLTDDNPRSERSADILAAMLDGVPEADRHRVQVCPNRAAAIGLAVAGAAPGDVVVVAGKGHERGQEVAGTVTDFDDREVLRHALQSAAGAA